MKYKSILNYDYHTEYSLIHVLNNFSTCRQSLDLVVSGVFRGGVEVTL